MKLSIFFSIVVLTTFASANKFRWYSDCGESKYPDAGPASKIIGGKATRPNEFPWQAAVRWSPGNNGDYRYCGGVLISPRYVLTAAHCMLSVPTWSLVVVFGDHLQFEDTQPREIVDIESYVIHEKYGQVEWYDSDISLIRLAESVNITDDVRPACAPLVQDYAGKTATISGWGTTKEGTSAPPKELMYIERDILTNAECATVLRISDTMICAGDIPEYNQDACQGDSGGPLTVYDSTDKLFSIVGLVSWGIGCADGYPGVYCRVSMFLDWIDSHMASLEAAAASKY